MVTRQAGQRCPACLVTMCYPHDSPGADPAQRRCEQPEWRRRPEQDRVAAVFLQNPGRTARHRGHRQHQRGRMPDHRERLPIIEGGRALPRWRVDDHGSGLHPGGEGVHKRLDPTAAGRKVIAHDQDLRHPSMIAQMRPLHGVPAQPRYYTGASPTQALHGVGVRAGGVRAPGRGGPGEVAGAGLLEVPAGVLLELVVAAAGRPGWPQLTTRPAARIR